MSVAATENIRVAKPGSAGSTKTNSGKTKKNRKTDSSIIQLRPYEKVLQDVPIMRVGMVSQIREEYDGIEELAQSIASSTLQHPPAVMIKPPKAAQEYLDLVNFVWDTNWNLSDLPRLPGRKVRYCIVFAGHRRTLALQHLWDQGCNDCRGRYGIEQPGKCFGRHEFSSDDKPGHVGLFVFERVAPAQAVIMQLEENSDFIRKQVPTWREAKALTDLCIYARMQNPGISRAQLARDYHTTSERLCKAERFMDIATTQPWILDDVRQGRYNYGHALEFERLVRLLGYGQEKLHDEQQRIILGKVSVKAFQADVNKRVKDRLNGVSDLFSDNEMEIELVRSTATVRRKVFERELSMGVYAASKLFEKCAPLLRDGSMGSPTGLFRDTSIRHVWREVVSWQRQILPLLQTYSPVADAERDLTMVADFCREIDRIEAADRANLSIGLRKLHEIVDQDGYEPTESEREWIAKIHFKLTEARGPQPADTLSMF